MYRVGLCDDDVLFMKRIIPVVEECFRAVCNEDIEYFFYKDDKSVIDGFGKNRPDILFMDIEFGEVCGFDVMKRIAEKNSDVAVVYMSNYSSYVTKSFVCRPLGFIRKSDFENDFRLVMYEIKDYLDKKYKTLSLHDGANEITLPLYAISVIEMYDHKMLITFDKRKTAIRESLNNIEEILKQNNFVKVNRSTMINLRFIKEIDGDCIKLESGDTYTISRRKVNDVTRSWILEQI